MDHKTYTKLYKTYAETRILKLPRHSLATFGPTNVNYYFIAELGDKLTRVREGMVLSKKPQIILTDRLNEVFEGFGDDAKEFVDSLAHAFGTDLKCLGYKFHNKPGETQTLDTSFDETLKRVSDKAAGQNMAAIVKCPDQAWHISALRLIIEMTERSFPMNMTELTEHGFFDPDRHIRLSRAQVEKLFRSAQQDRNQIKPLVEYLRHTGLFEEYQDRFFSLVN